MSNDNGRYEEVATADERPEAEAHGFSQAPIPLGLPDVPRLPDGIFTGWLGDQVDAVAAATETPRELAGMFGLSVLGAVCQKRFAVRPEPDYFEPLCIWTISALESGNRKTSVYGHMTKPLIAWETEQAVAIVPTIKEAESARKSAEGRIGILREKAKKEDNAAKREKMHAEIAELEAGIPEVPSVPRLFTQDVTTEHLGTMLANNGERLSLLSDEGGIFEIIGGRYNSGIPNLDLLLQAHAGSPVRVDRGSRPPVILAHPTLSIGLSPQPDVLKGLMSKPGFRGRGLLARFMYCVPRSRVGYRQLTQVPLPATVVRHYESALKALADVPPDLLGERELSRTLMFSADAYTLWKEYQRDVEKSMSEGGRLEHLKDWGGKLPGAAARIAGLFHCADFASDLMNQHSIQPETMARAIDLARFLTHHAIAVFDLMGADENMEAARDLWRSIAKARRETFTARDAWHPLRGKYRRIEDVAGGFDILIERNYISEPHQADFRQPGRPSRLFHVNPLIAEDWQ